jgi:hypothetical protein
MSVAVFCVRCTGVVAALLMICCLHRTQDADASSRRIPDTAQHNADVLLAAHHHIDAIVVI